MNNINMKAMKNQMPKQQVMNDMQTILSLFAFLQCSQNCTIQVKATLNPRVATLESHIHQQAANEPLTKKNK